MIDQICDLLDVLRSVFVLSNSHSVGAGCAWPDPRHVSSFEFCENGAKAVAAELTRRRVTRELFATHTVTLTFQLAAPALPGITILVLQLKPGRYSGKSGENFGAARFRIDRKCSTVRIRGS